jgi:hypothetical protein
VYVFRDAKGAVVATLTNKIPGDPFSDATVACGGTETVVPSSRIRSAECTTVHEGDCTPGVCP